MISPSGEIVARLDTVKEGEGDKMAPNGGTLVSMMHSAGGLHLAETAYKYSLCMHPSFLLLVKHRQGHEDEESAAVADASSAVLCG